MTMERQKFNPLTIEEDVSSAFPVSTDLVICKSKDVPCVTSYHLDIVWPANHQIKPYWVQIFTTFEYYCVSNFPKSPEGKLKMLPLYSIEHNAKKEKKNVFSVSGQILYLLIFHFSLIMWL